MIRSLAILALAPGCASIFGIGSVAAQDDATATIDAPQGAGFTPCADRTAPPAVCADFEEETPRVYVSGIATAVATSAPNITAEVRAPARSGTRGFWITSTGGTLTPTYTLAQKATVLDARFALQLTSVNMTTAGLFRLHLPSTTYPCFVDLQVDPTVPEMRILGHCGSPDSNPYLTVTSSIPIGWFDVHLTFNIVTGTATITLDGGVPLDMAFNVTSTTPATPTIRFGIDSPNSTNLVVGYDDVAVELQ